MDKYKKDMILWGRILNERGFVCAGSGNLSVKKNDGILITATATHLGFLSSADIIEVRKNGSIRGKAVPSSELPMHKAIHENFAENTVVHAHSPFTVAFFHFFDISRFEFFSFESKYYLEKFKVLPQKSINVSDVDAVVSALKECPIAVLKDHGVVAIGPDYKTAFGFIELLEELARINFFACNGNNK